MRRWSAVVLFLCLTGPLLAAKDSSVAELKARLQNATRPEEKLSLSVEIAERQATAADQLFRDGKSDEGQAAVRDVADYAGQARDAANLTGHRLKNTEIAVRKLVHRLTDLKRQLAYDDQAPVQAAIDQLEKIRTDLLNHMFKGGK